ncbi:MAG: glycosyltransferase family 39 protein [Candidatus Omnitrophica bacterium]|nr:glycosyltransferase family 39 protein [Candidatus Omnitrophota bacterium]
MKIKKIILVSLLAAGFLIRFLYLFHFQSTAFFNPVFLKGFDQRTFNVLALEILKHPIHVDGQVFWIAPLYSYFLAFIYFLFGKNNFFAAGFIGIVIDVLTGFFIYLLGRKVAGEWTGLGALFLYIFYRTIIVYSTTILSDGFILFLNLAFIVSLYYAIGKKPNYIFWVLSGVVLGLASLAKPTILAFLPFLFIGLFLYPEQNYLPEKKHLSLKNRNRFFQPSMVFSIILISAFLIILPVTLRNWYVAKTFVPIAREGWTDWKLGNSIDSPGFFYYPHGFLLSPLGLNFWLLFLKKIFLFFNTYEWPQDLNVYFMGKIIPVLKFAFVHFGFVVPFGVTGIFFMRNVRKNFLFYSFVFIQFLWVVLFFVVDRFRLPFVACLMIPAVFAGQIIFLELKNKRLIKPFIIILIAGLIFFFSSIPLVTKRIPPVYYKIFYQISFKNILYDIKTGNFKDAEEKAETLVRIIPYNPVTHFLLATVYFGEDKKEQAQKQAEESLQIDPNYTIAKQFLKQINKF